MFTGHHLYVKHIVCQGEADTRTVVMSSFPLCLRPSTHALYTCTCDMNNEVAQYVYVSCVTLQSLRVFPLIIVTHQYIVIVLLFCCLANHYGCW